MLIDTHSHIQLDDYRENRDDVLARARAAGVFMVAVGVDVPSSQAAIDLAADHDDVVASVGLHPHDAAGERGAIADGDLAKLAELAASPAVVAIGECGLDYYYNNSPRDAQARVFRQQIELALRLNKLGLVDRERIQAGQLGECHGHRPGSTQSADGLVDVGVARRHHEAGLGALREHPVIEVSRLPRFARLGVTARRVIVVGHQNEAQPDALTHDFAV